MGTVYIDRGFLSLNGVELVDIENISLKMNDGTKAVPTMTRNRRNKGVTKGNREITTSFSVAVQSKLGTPKLEDIDYEENEIAMTFEHGGDRYTLTGGFMVDMDQSAPGVGSEGKKTWNMVFMDAIDQVGNSSLFNLSL